MMSRSPRCYIPSFVEIGPPVPEKKIFEAFLTYMGVRGGYLGHVRIREQTFVPPTQGSSTKKMALIGQVVSEKMFKILEDGVRRTAGRTPEHGYTISSPMSLRLR